MRDESVQQECSFKGKKRWWFLSLSNISIIDEILLFTTQLYLSSLFYPKYFQVPFFTITSQNSAKFFLFKISSFKVTCTLYPCLLSPWAHKIRSISGLFQMRWHFVLLKWKNQACYQRFPMILVVRFICVLYDEMGRYERVEEWE